jgi:subtilisin family serine protease
MDATRPQSGWNDEFEPHQNPQFRADALLVAPHYVDLVIEELTGPGVTLTPRDRRAPIVRVDVQAAPDSGFDVGEAVDRVRSRFKHAYEPILSPVHVMTSGQPNLTGNPQHALPQRATAPLPPRDGSAGGGITIAIIDNGVTPHDWLDGGYLALPADFEHGVTVDLDGREVLGPQSGHGVFLAGLALQQAPGASVKIVRTADNWGQSDIDDVAAAILRVAAHGADVINLSLGAFTRNNRPPWALQRALGALPHRTAVVASAGNSSTQRAFWPAALPRVTAVGALAAQDGGWRLADFTNYGPWVDAYIPASDVLSTFVQFQGDAFYRDEQGNAATVPVEFDRWATWSGTSMAAAIWSGAVARAASELGVGAHAASEILLDDPQLTGFARRLTLSSGEQVEAGTNAKRRALAFDGGNDRAPAAA